MRLVRNVLIGFGILIFVWWGIRAALPSQIDDVNPLMNCSDWELEVADVYYVVPAYENIEIGGGWCSEILDRDKELAMHGVYHSYEEFGVYRDREYFDYGARIFEECFGGNVTRFKPPQLVWTSENSWIKDKVEVDLFWNQVFHKVYHCGDSGLFPNWLIEIF